MTRPRCPSLLYPLQACNRNNLACVPLYDTLGDAAVQYVISHSEVRVVVVSAAKAPALTKILAAMGSSGGGPQQQVASVVVWGPASEEVLQVGEGWVFPAPGALHAVAGGWR